jgi:hypothetical protein
MITREQAELIIGDVGIESSNDLDLSVVTAVNLLRTRIPKNVQRKIIDGSDENLLYLTDVDETLPHLTEEDLKTLAYCGCYISEHYDRFVMTL